MKKLNTFSLAFPAASLYADASSLSFSSLLKNSFRQYQYTFHPFKIDVFDFALKNLDTWIVIDYNYEHNEVGEGFYTCLELSPLQYASECVGLPHQYRSKGEIILKYAILNKPLYLPKAKKFTPFSFQDKSFKFFKRNITKA